VNRSEESIVCMGAGKALTALKADAFVGFVFSKGLARHERNIA
jgi:hypothetical protein